MTSYDHVVASLGALRACGETRAIVTDRDGFPFEEVTDVQISEVMDDGFPTALDLVTSRSGVEICFRISLLDNSKGWTIAVPLDRSDKTRELFLCLPVPVRMQIAALLAEHALETGFKREQRLRDELNAQIDARLAVQEYVELAVRGTITPNNGVAVQPRRPVQVPREYADLEFAIIAPSVKWALQDLMQYWAIYCGPGNVAKFRKHIRQVEQVAIKRARDEMKKVKKPALPSPAKALTHQPATPFEAPTARDRKELVYAKAPRRTRA